MRRAGPKLNYFKSFEKRPGYLTDEMIGRNAHIRPGEKWVPGVGYVRPRANEEVHGELRGQTFVKPPSDAKAQAQAARFVVDDETSDFAVQNASRDLRRPKSHGEVGRPIPAAGRDVVKPEELRFDPAAFEAMEPLSFGLPISGADALPSATETPSASTVSLRQRMMNARRGQHGAQDNVVSLAEATKHQPIELGDDDFDMIDDALPPPRPIPQTPSPSPPPRASTVPRRLGTVTTATRTPPAHDRLDQRLSNFWRAVSEQQKQQSNAEASSEPPAAGAEEEAQPTWRGLSEATLEREGTARDQLILDWLRNAPRASKSPKQLQHYVSNRLQRQMWRDALAILDVVAAHGVGVPTSGEPAPLQPTSAVDAAADMLFGDLDDAPPADPRPSTTTNGPPPANTEEEARLTHGAVMGMLHEILLWSKEHASVAVAMMAAGTATQGDVKLTRKEYHAVLAVCNAAADVATASRVLAQMMDEAIEHRESGGISINRSVADDGTTEVSSASGDLTPTPRSFRHCVVAAAKAGDWQSACAFVDLLFSATAGKPHSADEACINDAMAHAASACVEGGNSHVGLAASLAVLTKAQHQAVLTESDAVPPHLVKRVQSVLASMASAGVTPAPNDMTLRVAFRGLAAGFGNDDFERQLRLLRLVLNLAERSGAHGTSRVYMHALEDAMLVLNGIVEAAGDLEWMVSRGVWRDAIALIDRAASSRVHGVGVSAKMLSAAMHHANCCDQWAIAAELYTSLMPKLAPPHSLDNADREASEPDPTGAYVLAYATARGHEEELPNEAAEVEWQQYVVKTGVPALKSPWQLDLDSCLHQYLRAATLAIASTSSSKASEQTSHPLLDGIVANFGPPSWRTATLPSYLALLHEANRHQQVIAAYHVINENLRIYTESVLDAIIQKHRAHSGEERDVDPQQTKKKKPVKVLPEPSRRSLEKTSATPRAPVRRDSMPQQEPMVSMSPESLAIVIDSCRATGKWKLAVQCVEWMANCRSVERNTSASEGGDTLDADVAAADEGEELLQRAIVTVKASCKAAGYTPDKWRVPHQVP